MRILSLIGLFLFLSCVQEIEPIDQTAGPAKISNVSVLNLKSSEAEIAWSLDIAGTGYVEYGLTSSYGSTSVMKQSNLMDHLIKITNLSSDQVYHFRIISIDKNLKRVVSKDQTFRTLKEAPIAITPAPVPKPVPLPPTPEKLAKAPILKSAILSGSNYILSFEQAPDSLAPLGGYDTFVNNNDQNDNELFFGLMRTISALDSTKQQCFTLEARYTQLEPKQFLRSNEVCVAAVVPAPPAPPVLQFKAPILISAKLTEDNYIITLAQAPDSLVPAGGYDTYINDQDQNDNETHLGLSRSLSGLDKSMEQCFSLEARYTQLDPKQFLKSNEICVAGVIAPLPKPTPVPVPPTISNELKAFPSAFGAGANTTGGRGGKIIRVTNLNSSGAGSFVDAMKATGKRSIVFDVSGTIDLKGAQVYIQGSNKNNLTVFGQSAPLGGITVMNGNINFYEVDNVIIRFIRFRNAEMSGGTRVEQDAFTYWGGSNIILDHCSASFGGDEAISMVATSNKKIENVTLQRSLLGNSKTGSLLGSSSRQNMVGDISYHLNLVADNGHRTPNMAGEARFDVINNVIFNWNGRASTVYGNSEINHIANYYKSGKATEAWSMADRANKIQSGSPLIFSQSNYFKDALKGDINESNESIWKTFSGSRPVSSNYFTAMKFKTLGAPLTILSAEQAYTAVTNDVGANRYLDDNGEVKSYIDSYDSTKLSHVKKNISGDKFDWVMPKLPSNTRPMNYDTDNDGMADAWEKRVFGSLAQTANGDQNKNGYTNLEEFMNQVDF